MKRSILASVVAMQCLAQALALTAFARDNSDAKDGAYLDPAYKNLRHPKVNDHQKGLFQTHDVAPTQSDTLSVINKITPIRDQSARGTCSIFSSTAMVEAMMIIRGHATSTLDLSEEWLEYMVTRVSDSEGSTSSTNFNAILDNGDVEETLLPYIGETWTDTSSSPLAQTRCGTLANSDLSECLLGHNNPNLMTAPLTELANAKDPLYSPTFLSVRKRAQAMKSTLQVTDRNYDVSTTADIKALLQQGIPVSVEVSFYYGAWNHRGGEALGMTRNMTDWGKGIVFYPEIGSIDRDRSPEQPDGHSVLIVGYDDNVTLTKDVQMTDGTTQTFTRKGVYYFKNSWGTDNFGPLAMINGQSVPGYGTMSQDYANEFGQFFQLPLQ